ncbi:myosin-11-like [Drosophila nasuta]|uniref:myosin-11-like n=1 Tax=Drosophila nasuta TaxID=42062 RepID=UPI00295EBFA4|nr:myosin-11-like [Drosophila nasuta]
MVSKARKSTVSPYFGYTRFYVWTKMARQHKNSQFPLFNSHFVPQMWLNVPSTTYGGYSYQQCFDQANYNLLMNSILMQQHENQQLRTKLQIVEKKLLSEMSLKIHEMPNCGTECAKKLQEKNEKISILEEELTKMIDKFGKLVKKDSELLLENVKCIHEPEEITNLKQKLSELIINIENEREVNSVNAKRLLEKEEEMSNLEAELAEMKYKIEKESELKKENTIRLQEKEEEIANLDQQLSEITISIEKERDMNREEHTKYLHEQEEEIAKLKQELSKLSSYVQELNRQVHERNAKLNAFSVINDMLVSSIESRDKTIVQYKKKTAEKHKGHLVV